MALARLIRPIEYPVLSQGERLLIAREADVPEAPKPRLLDRVREAIRARHYSRRTEKTYVAWIRRYIVFHGKRHPAEMGSREITEFLSALAVKDKVAASTQNQALRVFGSRTWTLHRIRSWSAMARASRTA